MIQIFLTIFYCLWLCAVLAFLFLIWRRSAKYTQHLEETLIAATMRTAKAAENASEAAFVLACKKPITTGQIIEGGDETPPL